jgi:DNA-binding GntR family transcriptional regulator
MLETPTRSGRGLEIDWDTVTGWAAHGDTEMSANTPSAESRLPDLTALSGPDAGLDGPLGPQVNGTLAAAVADRMRNWIMSGALEPGARIRLAETAQRLGVSPMPVRDALRLLESEQLVTTAPHRGARVSELSAEEIEELYAVRAGLEGLAAKVAIRNSDDESDARLQALFDRMAIAHETGSAQEFAEADRLFHRALYSISGRPRLVKRIIDLWDNSARSVPLVYRSWVPSRSALESHRIILSAVLARNPEAAERFTREHTDQAAGRILEAIAERPATARQRRGRAASRQVVEGS